MVMWQFFSSTMYIYLRSHCLMSAFRYLIWSSFLVQSLVVPTGRMLILSIQICNTLRVLYLVNQLATLERVCTATGRKLSRFCLLWRLTMTFSLSALLLQYVPDRIRHGFVGRYLANLWIFEQLVSLRARPFQFPWQHQLDIGYEYWKQLALRNRKKLAYETKTLVFKHKQRADAALFGQAWLGGTKVTNSCFAANK